MLWLYLAITAYFINAIVAVIDKYLLAVPIPKYHAYAFAVSILSLTSILLIPFGISWFGLGYFLIAFSSGAAFFIGLLFLYKSIKESDISIASTQAGTLGAVFTYIFSILILSEPFSSSSLLAFVFLVLGIFMLGKVEKHIFTSAVLAGVFFGMSFVLLKLSFNNSDFINGLFWTRMGFVGSAFLSLFSSHVREDLKFSYKSSSKRSKSLFVFNKFLSGTGFVVLYFAIKLGNVSLVNALLGFQFLFTFLLALALRTKMPEIKEKIKGRILAFKVLGIGCVVIGFILLFK